MIFGGQRICGYCAQIRHECFPSVKILSTKLWIDIMRCHGTGSASQIGSRLRAETLSNEEDETVRYEREGQGYFGRGASGVRHKNNI